MAFPIDSGTAEAAYVRSGGALWFLAIGAGGSPGRTSRRASADADLPRLIIGFRVTTELLGDIGRRFLIENLTVASEPVPGEDVIALDGVDGQPLGWVSWTSPTPGRAVLRATLWPLVGLMVAVAVIVLLVSRELLRSARRLEAALAQARAADRTKTEFLSNVSHELRTPLNGVIGVAQLLQMREQEPEARHMLDILLASAHSQLQLVNGLLDITRIEAGAMALEQAPFDPAAVLEDTVRLIAPDIEEKRLALRVAIAPAARRPVLGDALAFRQIATNLIGNALKFTDSGGIGVELGIGDAGALILAVSDTGVGIDPGRARPHLRALRAGGRGGDAARRRRRTRARDHPRPRRAHGRLDPGDERAREGRDLHRRAAAARRPTRWRPRHDRRGGRRGGQRGGRRRGSGACRRRQSDQRVRAHRHARSLGLSTLSAADGVEAVEIAAERCPELIFMDVQMPRMDGIAAARQISERDGRTGGRRSWR